MSKHTTRSCKGARRIFPSSSEQAGETWSEISRAGGQSHTLGKQGMQGITGRVHGGDLSGENIAQRGSTILYVSEC